MQPSKSLTPLIAMAVLALGVGLLVRAGYTAYETWRFMAAAERAEGRVVEIVAGHTSRKTNETTYAAMIEFQPAVGAPPVTFRSGVAASRTAFAVGEAVPVLFLPDEPDDARLETTLGTRGREIIFAVMGLAFILVGGFVLRRRR